MKQEKVHRLPTRQIDLDILQVDSAKPCAHVLGLATLVFHTSVKDISFHMALQPKPECQLHLSLFPYSQLTTCPEDLTFLESHRSILYYKHKKNDKIGAENKV
jgi:hypothetical protein